MLELTLDGGMMERDDAQRECTDREEFLGQYAERQTEDEEPPGRLRSPQRTREGKPARRRKACLPMW